ncbi:MAG: acyl-CoA thioesterase [Candidatus Schekmanbacteria bacterium]|nr:acyl-CoA thioesterase [Candidatus Schekmanbacteria bacterium]
MRERIRHWQRQSVRWGDMDALGHVNNAAFFTYCESARITFFQRTAVGEVGPDSAQGPVLASAQLDFKRQVRFPTELDVGVYVSRIGTKSYVLGYLVLDAQSGAEVASGSSAVVWFSYRDGKTLPLSPEHREALLEHLVERPGDEPPAQR